MDPGAMFPQPPSVSAEDELASFDNVPLFMKSLPEDAEDNPAIEALQSLAHEGTPDGMYTTADCLETSLEKCLQRSHRISRSKEMIITKANDIVKPRAFTLKESRQNHPTSRSWKLYFAIALRVIWSSVCHCLLRILVCPHLFLDLVRKLRLSVERLLTGHSIEHGVIESVLSLSFGSNSFRSSGRSPRLLRPLFGI